MRLTPLSPECVLLDVCGVQLLLECPIDVSALSLFLPTHHSEQQPPVKKHRTGLAVDLPFPFREIHGSILVDAEPWYKTPAFHLVDVALINAVVVSNPDSMLGLPFLTRDPQFTGKIFVTDAAATLGGLLIHELVASHAEYIKLYGRAAALESYPSWTCDDLMSKLPQHLKEELSSANWQQLYSEEDVKYCMQRLHRLNYGEEAVVDDCVTLKPFSSGFCIGAANWVLKGPLMSLTYVSASSLARTHAAAFDFSALVGPQTLLLSDLRSFQAARNDTPEQQKPTNSTFQLSRPWVTAPVKFITSQSRPQYFKALRAAEPEKNDPVKAMCNAVVDTISKGGSVLFPSNMSDGILAIVEAVCTQLAAANLGDIPVFCVSAVAEDFLTLINTVPEWVSSARQEKLYAGEPSFLVDKKRVHHLRDLSSPRTIGLWKEPCVVFAAHASLRMGPSVHLLQRWRQRPECLLVFTDRDCDKENVLCPFEPLKLQVLYCPLAAGLRLTDVEPLVQRLRPKAAVVPDVLRTTTLELPNDVQPLFYSKLALEVTLPEVKLSMQLSTGLANNLKPPVPGASVSRISAQMYLRDGKFFLEQAPTESKITSKSYGGVLEIEPLVRALKEIGLGEDIQVTDAAGFERPQVVDDGSSSSSSSSSRACSWLVSIRYPAASVIEVHVSQGRCCIKADDPVIRTLVSNAVTRLLQPI